jgi:hypothetical protein
MRCEACVRRSLASVGVVAILWGACSNAPEAPGIEAPSAAMAEGEPELAGVEPGPAESEAEVHGASGGEPENPRIVYRINGDEVSEQAFFALKERLREVPGTAMHGEGPEGLVAWYEAVSEDGGRYKVETHGSEQNIAGPLPQ